MPGADVVTITIQTVDASSGAIANVETKLTGLGTAGVASGAKLKTAGAEGTAAFAGVASAAEQGAAGARSAMGHLHGNMREVSGSAREMGLNMGYGLRRFLADSPAAMAALRAMSGLFIGLAAVAIFEQMAVGAAHLYEKWFSVNKAVEDYTAKAAEAASKKLFDTASMETAASMLGSIGTELDSLQSKRVAFEKASNIPGMGIQMPGAGMLQYMDPLTLAHIKSPYSTGDAERETELAGKQKQLNDLIKDTSAKNKEQELQGQKAYDSAALQGYAKRAAMEGDELALVQHKYAVMRTNEAELAKIAGTRPPPTDSHAKDEAAESAHIRQQYAGEGVAAAKAEQQTIITAQNEATNSHLMGIALVQSQEEQAIDAVLLKYRNAEISKQGLYAVSAAIWEKFEAQKLLKLQEEQRQVDRIFAHAGQVGDTGTRAIRNTQEDQIAAIPIGTDPEKAVGMRVGYEQEGDNKVLEAHEKFAEEMLQIDQRADDAMLGGYARIDAQAQRLITSAQTKFAEANKRTDLENPADYAKYAADYQSYQAAETGILANAQRERVAYTHKTDEEIAHTEAEAARAYLPAWQAAQERIQDDYTQRLSKIKYDVDQHVLTEQQGARAATAAWQLANGEMERQQQATRDRLAGELSSLFDNPARYMEDRAKKLMFDILANWMLQLSESKGPMGSTMAWIFGMNPEMSTSTNPKTALGSIFAPQHAAAGAAGAGGTATLSAAGSTLSTAGSTLNAAGSTLSSSGTMLASAAQSLTSAAMAVSSMPSAGGVGAGGGFGGAGLTPGGGIGDFTDMFGSGGTGALGGGFQPSDINPAPTGATGVMGAVPGMASAAGVPNAGMMGQGTSLFGTLASGGVFGSGVQNFMSGGTGAAPMLNPNGVPGVPGGFQPTDINQPPTNDAGVLGTPPDSGTQSGAAGAMSMATQALGIGMAAYSTGTTWANNFNSGNTGQTFLSDTMSGAALGTAIMPGIGTAIGAAAGLEMAVLSYFFGDHGASQMRKYNNEQVVPAITKEMVSYTAAQVGYDQGMQDMNLLEMKAQAQAKQWGSGAVGVYQRKVVPEISAAIAEMERQQNSDRSGAIGMKAAQYDSGGVISHFGDFATGPQSGFIHARFGETMMNPMASMLHGPTLSAMNRGDYVSRGNGAGLSGGNSGGGGTIQITIQALDSKSVSDWLRMGGAQQIQSHLNANVNRYAGKATG